MSKAGVSGTKKLRRQLGSTRPITWRAGHPVQVVRPELTVYGESVKGALQALIEKLRGRRPQEIFLPTA